MNKHEAKDICRRYSLAPNKKLGQNFLVSETAVRRILEALSLKGGESVLEVGPGLGAISGGIAAAAGRLTAVEIDAGLCAWLRDRFGTSPAVALVHADFLKAAIPDEFDIIVSNLPYYCTSDMLFRFAEDYSAPRVYVMVQKELAQRLVARPGTKEYGALTVGLAFHFKASTLFSVPRDSFYPVPDVNSLFVLLERMARPELPDREGAARFRDIVRSSFWGRRKTLVKALSESPHGAIPRDAVAAALARMGLDRAIRGEMLGLEQFMELTRLLATAGGEER